MSMFHISSFCSLTWVAFAQTQVQTIVMTPTPITALQPSSASFQYPRATETLLINVVDTIVVQWKSNYINAWLYLYCDNGPPDAPNNRRWTSPQVNTTGTTEISPTSYINKATQDWTRPFACHLDLTYEDDYTKGLPDPRPHFNVTSNANQAMTRTYAYLSTVPPISPSTVSSGTSMSNTINTSSGPTSNAASHSEASGNNDTGLSTGATAGIAIGAIIGFIVLAVLGFMLWRKRKVDKSPPGIHGDNSFMHHDEFITSQKAYKGIHGHHNVPAELEPHDTQELPPQNEIQELPGSHVPR